MSFFTVAFFFFTFSAADFTTLLLVQILQSDSTLSSIFLSQVEPGDAF